MKTGQSTFRKALHGNALFPFPGHGTALALGFALLAQNLAGGQAAEFGPAGGNYEIVNRLAGDQVSADVALASTGGFLVWQDPFADGDGWGIRGLRLGPDFGGQFSHFRINQTSAGDQEHPRAAILGNGLVGVVWQGGAPGDTDIYIRFLSPAGEFIGPEAIVNTHRALVQENPAIAVLGDGGAVVVWTSSGQDDPGNSVRHLRQLQGVYGQRFNASGQPVGGEFLVNQNVELNQRDPAVTSLADGGFLVAWISEELPESLVDPVTGVLRVRNQVNVFARRFHSSGSPESDEIQVSSGENLICFEPTAAGLEEGASLIAWTQQDPGQLGAKADVYIRRLPATGTAAAPPSRLNEHLSGTQKSVRLAPAVSAEHLAVWSSFGQDGSLEGIVGRLVLGDGSLATSEFVINTATAGKQILPALGEDGLGRKMVVWSTYNSGTGFDLAAQRFDAVRSLPVPSAPHVLALDAGSLHVSWPELGGFEVSHYEVSVDGNEVGVQVTGTRLVLDNLAPAETHSFRLAYVLGDGRRSEWSEPRSGITWGTDGNVDGLPDDWQRLYFGKELSEWGLADADTDGDGASNLAEFLAGTNPLDAGSVLRGALQTSQGQLEFQWNVKPGMVYQVQVSTDLVSWSDLGPPRMAADSSDAITVDPGNGFGYFRVILVR